MTNPTPREPFLGEAHQLDLERSHDPAPFPYAVVSGTYRHPGSVLAEARTWAEAQALANDPALGRGCQRHIRRQTPRPTRSKGQTHEH